MKQIVDKLNKIAKKIDESVEIPQTDLIIDSLDAITKAYGGTPNDSNLIVDKLEDIYNNIGAAPSGNIEITSLESTNVAQYATAQVVDENLIAGNIKKDVEILGVTGTFEGGLAPYSATLFLFNGTNIAITENDGVYVGILDLPNYVFIPNTGNTVNVKINSNDPVPYDVSFDISTQQFSLGDPDLINTDYCIQGVLKPDGFVGAILGKQAETLTRLTISFNRTGYKTNWHVRAHEYGFLKFGLDYADVYYGVSLNSTSIETTTNVPCPMEVGNAISITTIGVTSSPK